ncbi:T9SS type A sorting domain-containing protein [Tenacibaculum agarivorans]|uniref:T9SS type A sorting domain-containing protein n=1 Tax=Tenacibaculum agarivorans TaxID=1908389 RepID=UPI00094B98ED|nr:T9SS type A sorting domain-containing protein [Tenacibaculum agarivorans]
MKVKLSFVFFLIISSTFLFSQETFVPDDNFEAFLEANGMGNGIANDDYVTTSAIQSVTALIINNQGISDLTGLQDFTSLSSINCSDNNITKLDLSFKRFFNVFARNNNLVEVDMKNGHNSDVNAFDLTNNPSLTCVQVDDETQSYYSGWGVDTGVTFKNYCELTAVTDNNFENYLETHDADGNVVAVGDVASLGNGIASDGYIATEKIAVVTSLDISSSMIADITGIEDFTALEVLDFSNNGVGNFDLSNNTALKELYCATNGMSSINVAANINLEILDCSDNSNRTINVSTNVKLKELNISSNTTTTLNLGSITTLENLNISDNELTSIDLSNLSNLTDLNCSTNYDINTIDFSALTSLVNLTCNEMAINSIDLSSNTALETLSIDRLSGFDVDLSNNIALISLSANSSDLTNLNVQNGNNVNITFLDVRNNQFTCIQVDDATASYLSTWQKDSIALFAEDCSTTNIPDINFEYHLENHDANGNVVPVGSPNSMGNGVVDDGKVLTARIKDVTYLNISSNSIDELDGLEAFESLEILDCSENNFNEFDFSQLPELKELYIHDLFFTVLNLSSNLKIEKLIYNNANSTTLNLGSNTVIKELNIGGNNITSFDVSVYTTLEVLNIDDNFQILPLNVRPLASLKDLSANNTSLRNLDVSQNVLLEKLSMDRASGFYLDLSNNAALTSFSARTSDMSGINIQNGNNANITLFDTEQNNSTLRCIQVDDPTASYLNTWNTDSEATFRLDCGETTVPDDNFENYLETHDADGNVVSIGDATSMGNGIANDNKVYTSNISSVEELDIDNLSISDLTGIEGFIALKTLYCHTNSIESLDLSQNVALERLDCYKSGLKSLNISQNTELKLIQCFRNELTSLDVSNNTKLTRIDAFNNQISALDLSQNLELTSINCAQNQLNSLDISNNVKLTGLTCYENNITSLDVTMLPLLEDLDCVGNGLISLDLSQNPELVELQVYENNLTSLNVSNNLKLVELFAESNSITSLDVSKNTVLEDLSIAFNQLTYLNIRNGNNTNLNPNDFDIRNNPGLTCVTVDDVTYANTTFPRKDAQTEYKLFCTETDVPDDNFEAYLETHNATGGVVSVGDPTSMGNGIANDDKVATERIQNIITLNISNQGITDVTGLEDFASLEQLRAFDNIVTSGSLDLTANSNLTEIYCSDMGLNTVDVSGLTKLVRLEFRNNNLSSIDVSSNSNLNYFNIDGNNFTVVNVSANTLLSDLRIRDNVVLNSIDISNNSNLVRLYVGGNSLTALNVSNNTLLENISAGENQLTTINVNGLNNLTDLFLEDMSTLTSLDVTSNTNLEDIGVSSTGLSVLDLSSLTKLIEVYANNTAIMELDFSASQDIEYIECQNSQLTSLNLKNGNNSGSIELYATGNPNLSCIQVDDPSASYVSGWEKDVTASFSDDCNWTYVPDDNFENYLETHDTNGSTVSVGNPTSMGNGIANDDFVKTANIENVINLFLNFQGIADFTGIEDFASLEFLACFNNAVNTSLDLTNNSNLKRIDANDMGLTSINITELTKLETINVSRNNLTSIDLSTNTALKDLIISSNSLTGLDVSNNIALEDLQIHETTLSTIDLSTNVNLTRIIASLNQFTSLDTQNNTSLETLSLFGNPLISYNLSHLTNLRELNLDETNIASIDISNNTNLREFSAKDINELVELNAKNGNNSNFNEFEVDGCPNLSCIQIDDPTAVYLTEPVWLKDATAVFRDDCNWTYVPDDNFENYLETHNATGGTVTIGDPTSMGNGIANDDYVTTAAINSVLVLRLYNLNITDFTGLESFTDLERFIHRDNTTANLNLDFTANTKLDEIRCNDLDIESIDITGLTLLKEIYLYECDLNSIDISTNVGLDDIVLSENNLTSLDVSNNVLLKDLQFHDNNIESIDISNLTVLESFKPSHNAITNLNLENNLALRSLSIGRNPIDELDISMLADLETLFAYELNISSLDISNNTKLDDISCYGNTNLTYLNLKNGNNDAFEDMDARNNPNLTCIEVDDPNAAYLSVSNWEKDAIANYAEYCRFTTIPDANFETYLETHNEFGGSVALGSSNSLGNGIIDDNLVPTGKIEVIQLLTPRNEGIEDFTGIESFKSLIRFWADNNTLTNTDLDLRNNTLLESVTLENTGITSLNINGLTVLEGVEAANNSLTSVDISTNTGLKFLNVGDNNLTSLDISNNDLTSLTVTNNRLGTIDVSNQANLTSLYCENTNITSLNIVNNPLLENLECGVNPLTILEVTHLSELRYLSFSATSISEIDLSNNTNLSTLECDSTPLTYLDLVKQNTLDNLSCKNSLLTGLNLRSGNNTDLDNVDVTGNPSLTCIEVDNPAAAALLGTWLKDVTANYAEFCRMTYVPDDAFETFLENNGYGNGVIDDYVYTALVEVSEGFNLHNGLVEDMTGIEDFRDMWFLACRNNANLTSIDLSKNTKLTNVTLANNNLASLDLSNNLILEKIYLDGNSNLGNVDISMLSSLNTLSVSDTGINSVDISNNPLLRLLNLNDNNFTELDISMYPSIVQLRIANNQLTSLNVANGNNDNFTWFDALGNPGLTCIKADKVTPLFPDIWKKDDTTSFALYCDFTHITDANFESYLETHDANGNVVALGDTSSLGNGIIDDNQVPTEKIQIVVNLNLERLDITDITGIEAFAALETLNLDYNDVTVLDLSSNSNLRILDVAENDLTELDLSVIPTLEEVELRSNKIRTLTVNNPNLKVLRASKNQYTSLDVTNCPQLEELGVTQTLLVSLDVRNGNNNLMADFNARFNDYLTCIEVDDASAAFLSTWDKDATASFSEDCNNAVWSGANGTDWTDDGNWVGNSVATTTQNVIVPVFVTSPSINSGVTAEMNDLEIQQLSSFTVEDNGAAIVNGDLNSSETITINSSVATSGTFIVKGTANGTITYERAGLQANTWSLVTAPVSGQSIKEFVENTSNNIRVNTTVTPNRYAVAYYDDSKAVGTKWVYYTADDLATNTITFEKGKSYIISRATDGSIHFTGTLETDDVSVVVNQDQWNALGSPYTAYLPINNNANNNFIQENLDKFDPVYVGVYTWDATQNKYVAKTLLDSDTSLTVGQGFFVKTKAGASSISFKEDQRLSDATGVQTFSREINTPSIQVVATQDGVEVETKINYIGSTTKGLDSGYDIGNFKGASFDVFTHLVEDSEGKDFTIQSLPTSDFENMSIPLGINSEADKIVEISVNAEALPSDVNIYLEDTTTGNFIDLGKNNTYTFQTEAKISGTGRFYLHTKGTVLDVKEDELNIDNINIFKSGKQEVTITGLDLGTEVTIHLFSILGSEVYTENRKSTAQLRVTPQTLETGVYIVRLTSKQGTISKKILFEK